MRDDEKVVSRSAGMWSQSAAIDVENRNAKAYAQYQDFFDDPVHSCIVDETKEILNSFFRVKDMYENQRGNRGNPFTVIKITNHRFPKMSISQKNKLFREPLEQLGVEIKFAKGTNSYLFYIR